MAYLSGFHAIEERIKSGQTCGPLLVAKPGPRAKEIVDLAVERKIPVNRTGTAELDRLAPDHRGIALEVPSAPGAVDTDLETFLAGFSSDAESAAPQNSLVVVLDEITDPHNYGAILRSCDQFGVNLVVSRHRRNAKHAQTVAQTSAGAVAWVPQAETPNLPRALKMLKEAGFWIYGADMSGKPARQIDLRGKTAIVLGGEGSGLSRLLRENCDGLIGIPSAGRVDSLNVSVAAGVLLYEAFVQSHV